MKHFLKISILSVIVLALAGSNAFAATGSGRNDRKTARQVKRELYGNSDKMVRKEAKKLEKEGWKTMDLPIEKQLERTWEKEMLTDEDGYPKYLYVTTEATAKTFMAAQMQSENAAKIRIAGMISSSVASIADVALKNNQIDADTANSISEAAEEAKILVQGKLGRVINSACLYKQVNGSYVVRTTVLYSMKQSMTMLRDAISQNIPEKDREKVELLMNLKSLIDQYEKLNTEE